MNPVCLACQSLPTVLIYLPERASYHMNFAQLTAFHMQDFGMTGEGELRL